MSRRSGGRTLGASLIDTADTAIEKFDCFSPRARTAVIQALKTLPRKAGGPAVPHPDRAGYLVIVCEVSGEPSVGIVYRYDSKLGMFSRVFHIADFLRGDHSRLGGAHGRRAR